MEAEFVKKWSAEQTEVKINRQVLRTSELMKIPELVEIFEGYSKWEWRFGETPDFKHQLENKFTWAMMDMQFNVEKGIIVAGKVFSDCLYPPFIDRLNAELGSGNIAYDLDGIKVMCSRVLEHFTDAEDAMQQ